MKSARHVVLVAARKIAAARAVLLNVRCIVALALGITGCASHPKGNVAAIDWNSRIGAYTYDQAVAELGRPDVAGESSGGKFCEWVVKRNPQMSFGFGVGTGSFGPRGGVGVGVGSTITPPPSGEYLRLQFDAVGKLKEWSKVRY